MLFFLLTILTPNAFSYGEVGINYQHRNIFDTETSVLRGCLDYVYNKYFIVETRLGLAFMGSEGTDIPSRFLASEARGVLQYPFPNQVTIFNVTSVAIHYATHDDYERGVRYTYENPIYSNTLGIAYEYSIRRDRALVNSIAIRYEKVRENLSKEFGILSDTSDTNWKLEYTLKIKKDSRYTLTSTLEIPLTSGGYVVRLTATQTFTKPKWFPL